MTTYGVVDIVNLIATDIQTNINLPAKTSRLYAEPTVIMPDTCPLAAVWCESTAYKLLTGAADLEAYEASHEINVGWYVNGGPDMADTGGTGDPTTVQALDATAEIIVNQIKTYTGGLPTTSSQLVATIKSSKLEPMGGVIWRALIVLTVEQAA